MKYIFRRFIDIYRKRKDKRMKFLIWGTGKFANVFIKNGYDGDLIGFIQTILQQESSLYVNQNTDSTWIP